jgi:type I restriction enzyme S subunit
MEVKTGHKQTEVGVIPEEWDVKSLKEFAAVRGGKRLPLGQSLTDKPTSHPYIRVTDMRPGGVEVGDIRYVPDDVFPAIKNYRIGCRDLFISVAGTLGIVGKIPSQLDGANLTENANRITNIICNRDFLLYNLSSDRIQRSIDSVRTVGAQPKLALGRIENFKIALPPTEAEQRAIAEALSDVDGLLAGLDRIIAKKRDLKQAAMQQLLTGQTRLPGFSGEWEAKLLQHAGRCLRGVSYRGDSDLSTHDTAFTKRLLRANNVQDALVVTDEIQFVNGARVSPHQMLKPDDILICMANGSKALVGKSGFFSLNDGFEYTFGAFMGCFRVNQTAANPRFVFYLLQTGEYRNYINNLLAGSSINNLRPASIESLEFCFPEPAEQTAIAEVLTEMGAELARLEQRREKTLVLKQAMMQELLTGKTRLI